MAIECRNSNKEKGLFVHVSGRIKVVDLECMLNMGTNVRARVPNMNIYQRLGFPKNTLGD